MLQATAADQTDQNSADRPHGGPPSVSLHAERLAFDGVALFEALDVALEAGRITCLLGPSGVGKSTLLRLLAGLTEPAPGDRLTCGDGLPLAGRVAYMDQRDLLLPWLSVLDNVTIGARLRGMAADTDRAAELLERVGLAGRERDRPAALSGGMRQRVALARTLMEDRPVVLMDEPFSSLDAVTRYRLQGLAASLLKDRTVLLVTHDPNEAIRLGHNLHVMAGRPAVLDRAMTLPGAPPRDPTDPALIPVQRELMARLGLAERGG